MKSKSESIAPDLSTFSSNTFIWAFALLALFTYPLGFFPTTLQVGQHILFNLTYIISFPATIILGLLAVPVLLFHRWNFPFLLRSALIVFSLMLLVNIPRGWEYIDSFFIFLGYLTIPVAAALVFHCRKVTISSLSILAFILWLIQVFSGTISLILQNQPVGTPGNVNWLAALLLMLCPFVYHFLFQRARNLLRNSVYAAISAGVLCFAPTVILLYHCQSRAAWLAITLLPFFLVMIWLRRPFAKIAYSVFLILAVIGCLAIAYIFYPQQLLKIVEKDIRVPVWTGTVVMTIKNPMGVGCGQFQERFAPLRTVSSYQNRLYAADMTNHPHNELLNVGAQLGIPAMLAFFIMISQVCRTTSRDPADLVIRIAAYFIIMTAMLDLTFVQPPTSFLGMFILGLNFPVRVRMEADYAKKKSWFTARIAVAAGAVSIAGILCTFDLFHDYYFRKAMIEETIAKELGNADMYVESKARYRNAVALYEKSIIPFSSVIPLYTIGFLEIKIGENIKKMEETLLQVADIDPNFSHLNLLFAQLNIQKKDYATAEKFLLKECSNYPQNETSWRIMYSFSAGTTQFDRLEPIHRHLTAIYRERARQNFGEDGLEEKVALFRQTITQGLLGEAVTQAKALVDRINHNFTDPLLSQLNTEEKWPQNLFSGGYTPLDMQMWQLRLFLTESMTREFGSLPVSPQLLTPWFFKQISLVEDSPSFPITVWHKRSGSPLATALLFSIICELNNLHTIINLDAHGQPESLFLIEGKNGKSQESNFYHLDLATLSTTRLSGNSFRSRFRWQPGKTMVYYPFTDFFLRNTLLSILTQATPTNLSHKPPTSRLVELFSLTGYSPPPINLLTSYCFQDNIRHIHEFIQSEKTQPLSK